MTTEGSAELVDIDRVPVGPTELRVTRMGLGTAALAGMYESVGEEQALATVQAVLGHGINFFDTAPLYKAGRCERYLGKALDGVPRDDFVLATKVGRVVEPNGAVVFDWTADGIWRSIEESLERLRLDRIDILHLHDPESADPPVLELAYPILADLRAQGVIKAVGAGMNQWQMLAELAREADFDCFLLAGRYTLLEQTALDAFLPLCQEMGIAVFLGGIYNSGILATGPGPEAKYNYRDAPSDVQTKARVLSEVCGRYGVPLRVAATQFPLAHPAVTAVVIGLKSPAEVDAAIEALETPVPAELWAELKAEGLVREEAPVPS